MSRPLKAGDALSWSAIEAAEAPRLSSALQSGLRAITFPVDEVNSFSGMLTPGDTIDLLYTVEAPAGGVAGSARALTVMPLLQSVRVLATGSLMRRQRVRGEDGREREVDTQFVTVTLHVVPEDAARIVLAQRSGDITAVLRNPQDLSPLALRALDSRSLYPRPETRVAGRPREYVEFIIGGRGAGIAARDRVVTASLAGSTP